MNKRRSKKAYIKVLHFGKYSNDEKMAAIGYSKRMKWFAPPAIQIAIILQKGVNAIRAGLVKQLPHIIDLMKKYREGADKTSV